MQAVAAGTRIDPLSMAWPGYASCLQRGFDVLARAAAGVGAPCVRQLPQAPVHTVRAAASGKQAHRQAPACSREAGAKWSRPRHPGNASCPDLRCAPANVQRCRRSMRAHPASWQVLPPCDPACSGPVGEGAKRPTYPSDASSDMAAIDRLAALRPLPGPFPGRTRRRPRPGVRYTSHHIHPGRSWRSRGGSVPAAVRSWRRASGAPGHVRARRGCR